MLLHEENTYISSDFPLKKGKRSNFILKLQAALSNHPNTPKNLKISKITSYWGDATQRLMDFHGLGNVIETENDYHALIAKLSGSGKQETQISPPSPSTSTWKDTLKDPEKTFGFLEKTKNLLKDFGIGNKNQNQQSLQGFSKDYAQQPFDPLQQSQSQPNTTRKIPLAVWIAVGVLALLVIGFFIFKMAKE